MLPETKPLALKAGHPWLVCLVDVGLNQKDEAMRWLEKAYEQGDFKFNLKDPFLDPLRSDPRFQDLDRRANAAQQRSAMKYSFHIDQTDTQSSPIRNRSR